MHAHSVHTACTRGSLPTYPRRAALSGARAATCSVRWWISPISTSPTILSPDTNPDPNSNPDPNPNPNANQVDLADLDLAEEIADVELGGEI